MDCEICFIPFSAIGQNQPKVLPCGHTFCGNCIALVPEKMCPTCRRIFTSSTPNYTIIQLLAEGFGATSITPSGGGGVGGLKSVAELEAELELEVVQRKREIDRLKREEIRKRITQIEENIVQITQIEEGRVAEKAALDLTLAQLHHEAAAIQRKIASLASDREQTEVSSLQRELQTLRNTLAVPSAGIQAPTMASPNMGGGMGTYTLIDYPEFIPCDKFSGSRSGYYFTTGVKGLGYYYDKKNEKNES